MAEAGEEKKDDFRYIVRLANTDIDGNKSIFIGLQGVKGVGNRVADVIVHRAGLNRLDKMGTLEDKQIEKIESLLKSYADFAPAWAMNRQHDFETGTDMHLIAIDIDVARKDDINRLKMIRCYRGIRHEQGQKVRGQRTKSNGRTGLTMGVSRQRAQPGAAPAAAPATAAPAPAAKK